jgi:polyhydroxybutyrate depolymerase
MDIHGLGVSVGDQSNLSDYSRITDQDNVIIIHPEGVNNGWNFGWCCTEEDDIGFLLKLIDRVIEERNIDENRIYLTGWSNGCYMSQEMASLASEIITAVACMAGYTDEPIPSDYSPIPIMEIHGLIDPLLLYGSSSTASIQVVGTLEGDEGAIQNMYHWADANNCPGLIPDIETANWDYSIKKFTNCANDTEVVLFTMNYAQHNPYLNDYEGAEGNPTGIDASQIAWNFLKDFIKENI